jgi:phosphoribosylformylglycinamidine cyclo-ligase
MPGFYPIDEYDLAGFFVGIVDKDKILKPDTKSRVMLLLP